MNHVSLNEKTEDLTPVEIAESVNRFIIQKCEDENIRFSEDFLVDSEELLSISREQVEALMSAKVKFYFDIIMDTDPQNVIILEILQQNILDDLMLSYVDKISLHSSISVYIDSYQYWTNYFQENNISIPRATWLAPQWLVSDTVMGFYGLMGSGGNPIVGGGAAIFASACAVLCK